MQSKKNRTSEPHFTFFSITHTPILILLPTPPPSSSISLPLNFPIWMSLSLSLSTPERFIKLPFPVQAQKNTRAQYTTNNVDKYLYKCVFMNQIS